MRASGPKIRQYFIESDDDERPFSRQQRAIVYQRSKNALDKRPFGTLLDVYADKYEWINHSLMPTDVASHDFRITIGVGRAQPYSASVFNISAMSFGALSANAIRALNEGARRGNFFQDTGEGSISRYHRENGGDLVWEIGSGYFGCRDDNGRFSAEKFVANACTDQVKMIEVKLSQGAKPGHGGVLPGVEGLARDRGRARRSGRRGLRVAGAAFGVFHAGRAAALRQSPARAFRRQADRIQAVPSAIPGNGSRSPRRCGRPACCRISSSWMAARVALAPRRWNSPTTSACRCAKRFPWCTTPWSASICGQHIRIGAAGKIITAFDIARTLALGADWCNAARGYMFSLGCIQSLSCHTDRCPTGVTTQNPDRQKALVPADKATRVHQFHENTLMALRDLIAAAGLNHPDELGPEHIIRRVSSTKVRSLSRLMPFIQPGALLAGTMPDHPVFQAFWADSRSDSFAAPALVRAMRSSKIR